MWATSNVAQDIFGQPYAKGNANIHAGMPYGSTAIRQRCRICNKRYREVVSYGNCIKWDSCHITLPFKSKLIYKLSLIEDIDLLEK